MNFILEQEDDDEDVTTASSSDDDYEFTIEVTICTGKIEIIRSKSPVSYEKVSDGDLIITNEDGYEVGRYVSGGWIGVLNGNF